MRVLFAVSIFKPYISGLTIYTERLINILTEVQATVLCNKHAEELQSEETRDRLKIYRAKTLLKVSKGFISFDWYIRLMRLLLKNDVIVILLPQAEAGLTALFSKLFGKKIISIYVCELDYPNKLVQKLIEFSNYIALFLAIEIVTLTKDYSENSKILKKFNNKTRAIYPSIPKPTINSKNTGQIFKKLEKSKITLGYVGRLSQEKGIEFAIQALDIVEHKLKTNVQLLIVGPSVSMGENKYNQKIRNLVNSHSKNVLILGTLKEEDMGAFYKNIDVLLLPSTNSTEAFGMVQVEAMKSGVPVVASNLPGVRIPIQTTGMGLLVPPKNPEELAEAITKVVSNKSYSDIAKIRTVNEIFNEKNVVVEWNNLLKFIMESE